MAQIKLKIKNLKFKIVDFAKANWIMILILLIGSFLRLYKIDSYMTFLGDEGRDVLIVRNLLVKADPILIGPGTSVGGMYLGPLYYYFMAPFLLLSNFNPVGPAIAVALLGILTIFLVYKFAKELFGERIAFIASLLYAVSPTIIVYSRSSWNPNIMPFFSLLSIYSIWKVYKEKKYNWLIVTAVSFAFVMQSHYLGVLLAPVILLYWILTFRNHKNYELKTKNLIQKSVFSILIFGFLMSPLLIFDFRHNFLNSKALYKFLTVREETVSIKPWTAIPKSYPIFEQINTSLIAAGNKKIGTISTLAITIFVLYKLLIDRKKKDESFHLIIFWLAFGLIGFGLYKQNIYDHYFGFLFPVVVILASYVLGHIYSSHSKFLVIIILIILIFINIDNSPLKYHPNNQMQRSINVANKILEVTNGKPFNLAVLAERNYEDGYRYFLELNSAKVLHADRWDKSTISDTLIVVCEMAESKCDPTHSPKAEVANFGWSKIESKWIVDGVIIYKLLHNK